jgi:serine/threonine protein phosphatase PrpC
VASRVLSNRSRADHSLAEALRDEGLSSAAATLGTADENSLVRVLGGEADVDVDLRELPLRAADYLLLCSDGLPRMVPERVLRDAIATIRDPQRVCDYLIDAANRKGGADNITRRHHRSRRELVAPDGESLETPAHRSARCRSSLYSLKIEC